MTICPLILLSGTSETDYHIRPLCETASSRGANDEQGRPPSKPSVEMSNPRSPALETDVSKGGLHASKS